MKYLNTWATICPLSAPKYIFATIPVLRKLELALAYLHVLATEKPEWSSEDWSSISFVLMN